HRVAAEKISPHAALMTVWRARGSLMPKIPTTLQLFIDMKELLPDDFLTAYHEGANSSNKGEPPCRADPRMLDSLYPSGHTAVEKTQTATNQHMENHIRDAVVGPVGDRRKNQ
ncbi:hypothetical protein PV325_010372, partial [Microctonus aethiopoides]